MSNDYFGYIATYREYQRGDHYRKALTGLGPHSSDFLATRLTRMAASLNGGPPVTLGPKDLAYQADHDHETARALAIGTGAMTYVPLYEATRPADGGTACPPPALPSDRCSYVVTQPSNIQRFDAARVRWVGGSNYFDLPKVKVQRLNGTVYEDFGDNSGEVQYRVYYPQPGSADIALYEAGMFEWKWEATFEAFDSDISLPDMQGVRRTQTPAGHYRFVIDGIRHAGWHQGALPPRILELHGGCVAGNHDPEHPARGRRHRLVHSGAGAQSPQRVRADRLPRQLFEPVPLHPERADAQDVQAGTGRRPIVLLPL